MRRASPSCPRAGSSSLPPRACGQLGHPKRLALLQLLLDRERACCTQEQAEDCSLDPAACDFTELTAAVELSLATVSHHLKELRRSGLIERGQRGRRVVWRARRSALDELATLLRGAETSVSGAAGGHRIAGKGG